MRCLRPVLLDWQAMHGRDWKPVHTECYPKRKARRERGRYPDLYHSYALTSVALVAEVHRLVDLRGQVVCDVGAGTGRPAIALGVVASRVYAVDGTDPSSSTEKRR